MEQLGTVETKLRNLINLQIDLANATPPKIDLDQLTRDCVTTTVRAMSYCSRIELNNLPDEKYGADIRFDFMHPDRWFVTQDAREPDGNFSDQWISIGPHTYQNAGLWFQSDAMDGDDIKRSVVVYLDIIDKQIPDEIFELPNKDHSYIILRYVPPLPNQYDNAWLKIINEFQEGSGVYLWVNSKNYYLEKAEIIGKNLVIEGKEGKISQSFCCFNDGLTISPPPWLNVSPDDEGQNIVQGGSIPIVLHHGDANLGLLRNAATWLASRYSHFTAKRFLRKATEAISKRDYLFADQYLTAALELVEYHKEQDHVLSDIQSELESVIGIRAGEGDVSSQYRLGRMYHGSFGVLRNYTEATKWYRQAADQGLKEAQLNLGVLHFTGSGGSQDYSEAAKWWLKAAAQGVGQAQGALGNLYREGLGVTQDFEEAVKWHRLSAEQGNAEAQYYLARAYDDGQGVAKDMVMAHKWYTLAAAQGYPPADDGRAAVAKKMAPDHIAEAERLAREWNPTPEG